MDNNINTREDNIQRLYFNAREWTFNKACEDNVGSRSFMTGPDGELAEAFTIGNWSWDWTEILTKPLILQKNTPHTFTFWLNGGENDKNNEVCRFEVVFNNDYENRYTYNLNRGFIRPVKRLNGWELYEIPFITGDNEYTELRFVAQCAYMTVMNAKDKSAYDGLPDTVDEFAELRPQRHNIVFQDGWPANTWYSTKNLRIRKDMDQKLGEQIHTEEKPKSGAHFEDVSDALEMVNDTLNDIPSIVSEALKEAMNSESDLRRKVYDAISAKGGEEHSDYLADFIMQYLAEKRSDIVNAISEEIGDMVEKIDVLVNAIEPDDE